jgi:SH3-like domain-containing protein
MRSGVVRYATRLLVALVVLTATAQADPVQVVPRIVPDNADGPIREKHHHRKPEQEVAPPAKHPGKVEAHRAGEVPGKTKPTAADQKAHPVPPVAVVPPAPAPEKESTEPPPKLPRFAALKTDDTNMRKGPGQRYPIEWVYKRRDLPVEVEREYDVWRYVTDFDGIKGWVHQVTLSDRRSFMVKDTDATMRADADDKAHPVALLKAGVIGRLRSCDEGSKWCQVQVASYKGYLRRDQLWGTLPDEVVVPP